MDEKVKTELIRVSTYLKREKKSLEKLQVTINEWYQRVEMAEHILKTHLKNNGDYAIADFTFLRDNASATMKRLQSTLHEKKAVYQKELKDYQAIEKVHHQFRYLLDRKDLDQLFKNMNNTQMNPRKLEQKSKLASRELQSLMFEAEALLSLQQETMSINGKF